MGVDVHCGGKICVTHYFLDKLDVVCVFKKSDAVGCSHHQLSIPTRDEPEYRCYSASELQSSFQKLRVTCQNIAVTNIGQGNVGKRFILNINAPKVFMIFSCRSLQLEFRCRWVWRRSARCSLWHIPLVTIASFADSVAEPLHHLGERVGLVGQPLGGVAAQVIAAHHPEAVARLLLSNTGSLSEDDDTFTPICREDLIALMSHPAAVTSLVSGHLAL